VTLTGSASDAVASERKSVFRRRPDGIMARQVVDDILLLDAVSGQIHQLNRTAAFIWRKCEEASSAEGIAELLEAEFDVGHDRAVKDVLDALNRLQRLNLVVET
jgi:Coenzyme PQQ synthesis protein D (PqqD)